MRKLNVNKKKLLRLGWPFIVLLILSLVIFRERVGVEISELKNSDMQDYEDRLYEVSDEEFSASLEQEVECLLISDSRDEQSVLLAEQMQVVLEDMCVGYEEIDLADTEMPDLDAYRNIVITTPDLSVMEERVLEICDWVKAGGRLMNTGTYQIDAYFKILAAKAGIVNADSIQYATVQKIKIEDGFMINANDRVFSYDEPIEASMNVALTSDCEVYVSEADSGVPILWECDYGEGKILMMNQVLTGKVCRGFLCAAYSKLDEVFAYPVINGSVFYIDDFPSPVPSGESQYIEEEYGVNISYFYTNIWWPDMLALEEEYGIVHTGLIIEDYSDEVDGPFVEQNETERFVFFGNMLLNEGGELGFHGYNHMPLVLENFDYKGLYDSYNKWPSTENMQSAITQLYDFSSALYPEARFGVYVPPSNILSEEGREALRNSWSDLRVIAAVYDEGEVEYTQEFEVGEDGIVDAPRITSGTLISEYQTLNAFSELTFHYVQSHFLHPDDVLDVDRGAEAGWTKMYENFKAYVDYIYTAAPGIRNLSGSGFGEAVREFDKISVQRELKDGALHLTLGGFYQEAYFMVRMNEGEPNMVTGGTLEHLTGDLYLLHATSDSITIELK